MKGKVAVSAGFFLLAVILFWLSNTGLLDGTWLDAADRVASVVALLIAIFALLNPFEQRAPREPEQAAEPKIQINHPSGGSFQVGQTEQGDVIFGDPSTTAEQRANAAQAEVLRELQDNFRELFITLEAIEKEPPQRFWDIRRPDETEQAYQDRAAAEFRDYQNYISRHIREVKFSTSARDSFWRDLSYRVNVAERVSSVYQQQNEVREAFVRFEAQLGHLLSLRLKDAERAARSTSVHQEMMLNGRIALYYAVSFFVLVAPQTDIEIVYELLGIDLTGDPHKAALRLAAEAARQKTKVLEARLQGKPAEQREIDRYIGDPYLRMLRKAAGLPEFLKDSEVASLQNKTLDTQESWPVELLKLAAFAYFESDSRAALFYMRRALETGAGQLSPLNETFIRLSIDRLENPDRYDGSIGVMVSRLTAGGNFERAGLRVGDVIIAVNNELINQPYDLASALAKAGSEKLLLLIIRDSEKLVLPVNGGEPAAAQLTQLIYLNAIQL